MRIRPIQLSNIILAGVLVMVNIPRAGSITGSVGASIVYFTIGLVLGLILTGVFMFFYNLFLPTNKIRLGIPERITSGLICAILYSLLSKR